LHSCIFAYLHILNMNYKCYMAILLLCLLPFVVQAQGTLYNERSSDPTIVTRATSYGIGVANVFDNYLSPQAYSGVELRLSRESIHATKWAPETWKAQTYFQGYLDYTSNRADNNNTVAAVANWNYGLHRLLYETANFQVLVGGVADLNGGFIYNMRGGNNPANVRVHANLDASVRLLWHTHVGRFPFLLRYQLNAPMVGLMFSPHYGQSYYEIFSLGDDKGVVKPTTPLSQPTLRSLLSIDFQIRKTTLRVGYVCDLQQAKLNGLKSHLYAHTLMIGFVKHLKKL